MPEVNYHRGGAVPPFELFVLGGLWYSPMLFAKPWAGAAGLSDEEAEKRQHGDDLRRRLPAQPDRRLRVRDVPRPRCRSASAFGAGVSAGLCWVARLLGINYLFERRRSRCG